MTAVKKQDISLSERIQSNLAYYLPTILVAISVLLLWEFLVVIFDIQQFLLPKPSKILAELQTEIDLFLAPESSSLLFQATYATAYEAIGGLFIGCGAGICTHHRTQSLVMPPCPLRLRRIRYPLSPLHRL